MLYSWLEHLPGLENLSIAHILEAEEEKNHTHNDLDVAPEQEGETWSASTVVWLAECAAYDPLRRVYA